MKQIIKELENQLKKLRDIIEQRADKVYDMSEKWQASDACDEFMDKTMDIESQADELDSIIDQLKELI